MKMPDPGYQINEFCLFISKEERADSAIVDERYDGREQYSDIVSIIQYLGEKI